MKTIISTKWFLLPVLCWLAAMAPAEAAKRPFKAPPGTSVSYYSSGKDYAGWTIMANDYSANAVVAKIKLRKAYWKGKAFQRYVKRYFKNDQSFASYGVNVKVRWKNGAYTISGNSNGYRIYAKGRLAKNGFWTQGWVVGQPGSAATKSLENMVKALQ
jgi:hypothetical protein